MPRSRRQVLGLCVTLLSAGCSSTDLSGSSDCTAGFHVSGEQFDPVTDLVVNPDEDGRAIVTEAVETGSAERTTYGQEPLRADIFVEHDEAFYETKVSTAEVEAVTAYRLNVEWEQGQKPPGDATVVEFDELPDADREALELAVFGSDERKRHPKESLSINDFPAPYPDGSDSSELVDSGVTWVRWNDRVYRIEISGSATQKRRTFRYEVEQVATGPKEFRTWVTSRYRIGLTGLSTEERKVVQKAVRDRYRECSPASDALRSLQNRLPDDKSLPYPAEGWYVRFDGEGYQLSIMQWVR